MNVYISILIAVFLFYLMGKVADVVILHTREIGRRLGIDIFFLGLVLGFLTSFPELSIGIGSALRGTANLSLGNLLGGIVVLIGFVLGLSVVLNRKIKTDGNLWHITPVLFFLVLPLILGYDGQLSFGDGLVMIFLYFLMMYVLYKQNKHIHHESFDAPEINERGVVYHFSILLINLLIIVVVSQLIVYLALDVLEKFNVSVFWMGLILFSVGTNLPEIMITLRSWNKHIKELSFSNLLGSSMANIAIVGMVTLINPITLSLDYSYYSLLIFIVILGLMFSIFYKTKRQLTRSEGVMLLLIYIIFVISQSYFGILLQ